MMQIDARIINDAFIGLDHCKKKKLQGMKEGPNCFGQLESPI